MQKYRAGIVGLTGIAASPLSLEPAFFGGPQPHSHAPSYANSGRADVVAVCELKTELFDKFKENWRHLWPNVATYTDYKVMLAKEKLDFISVCTPDHRHSDIVVDAANAGVKAIYCEKPIATRLADVDRMIAAVEKNGTQMVVNHTRRWFAEYVTARQIIKSGYLGKVARIQANMGGPRAMLFRNGTHLMDLVVFFADAEPVWVVGHLDPGHEDYGPRYNGDGGRDPAFDPGATALIKFDNGVIASYFGSKSVTPEFNSWDVTVYCEKGIIRVSEPGGFHVSVPIPDPLGSRYQGLGTQAISMPQYNRTDGTAAVRELMDLVENPAPGRVGQCPPTEARKVLSILLAIVQSQARGNTPVTAPFKDE